MRSRELLASEPRRVCAYCGGGSSYVVEAFDQQGRIVGRGYCCDDPGHWAWLATSTEDWERNFPETAESS